MYFTTPIVPEGRPQASQILEFVNVNAFVFLATYAFVRIFAFFDRRAGDEADQERRAGQLARYALLICNIVLVLTWVGPESRYERTWEELNRCHYDAAVRAVGLEAIASVARKVWKLVAGE